MKRSSNFVLSVVVPLYNEAAGLENFHYSLKGALQESVGENYEIIYCDDGSTDGTCGIAQDLHKESAKVKVVALSRNFGKENALTAGIGAATGDAILTMDGDGQHPTALIGKFVESWQRGNQVVIGVRSDDRHESSWKRLQSRLFYKMFNKLSDQKLIPGSTDFRLIDKEVQQAFLELKEGDRVTRGLIDWLGFQRELIPFTPKERQYGTASYSQRKLMILAVNSFVSLTRTPLYFFGYLGVFITATSFVLGFVVFVEQLLLEDPLHWGFTGTAMLGILIIFLVGIVLLSQGILSLYISLLHNQSKERPLFVINYQASAGIKKDAKNLNG